MSDHYAYPPMGFYFKVSFLSSNLEFSFQSVSGLTKEVVTESVREGGQAYDYALPVKTQYPDLVLKRGLWVPQGADTNPEIWHKWFYEMMQEFKVQPKNLQIDLLNPKGESYMTWNVQRAWPKKWTIADFNAEENQLVIETMEMRYDAFTIIINPVSPPEPTPAPG